MLKVRPTHASQTFAEQSCHSVVEAKDARPPKSEIKIARLNSVGDDGTHSIYKKTYAT